MRKRRKTKYIWLPTLGADPIGGDDETESNGFAFSCTTATVQKPADIALFPLLEDTPQEQVQTANPDPNISDFIGTDYVIKRIVGKIHLASENIAADTHFAVSVTCGMFVARADDTQVLLPIGASTNALAISNYDPNYVDNIREPWIWRRTWLLSNPSSTNATATEKALGAFYPVTNAAYGSIQDGPHVDAKTGRRIRNDERLWFAATCRAYSFTGAVYTTAPTVVSTVAGNIDIRVLGALRRARNRSNF